MAYGSGDAEADLREEIAQFKAAIWSDDATAAERGKRGPEDAARFVSGLRASLAAKDAEIEKMQGKIAYAEKFGMVFGTLKSSNCPEGTLAATAREGSEMARLLQGVTDLIDAQAEIERLRALLRERTV